MEYQNGALSILEGCLEAALLEPLHSEPSLIPQAVDFE